jgi:hypothetical protein
MAISTLDTISWWMVSLLFSLALCKPYMKLKKLKKQGIANTLALPIDKMLVHLPTVFTL